MSQNYTNVYTSLRQEPQQQDNTPVRDPQLTELLRQILPVQANLGANRNGANKDEEEKQNEPKNAISARELRMTLRMCGRDEDGRVNLLPEHFRIVLERRSGDDFKRNLIREHVVNTSYYDDADPPLTTTLLKMLLKR